MTLANGQIEVIEDPNLTSHDGIFLVSKEQWKMLSRPGAMIPYKRGSEVVA